MILRLVYGCLAVMLGCCARLPAAEAPAPLRIPQAAKAPLLDGRLDEAEWASAAKVENLYRVGNAAPAPETQFYLMCDNTWLYVGAQCANANMAHVEQLIYDHDALVYRDDSIEIFLRPGPDAKAVYYHFLLNFGNIGMEQRCKSDGWRDIGWHPPWRSVTVRRDDGWSAEIAIPLYCLEAEDLSGMKINLCRNMIEVELDLAGAKHAEKQVGACLRSKPEGKGYHDYANFAPAGGLGGFQPEIPFAPRITRGAVTGLAEEGGSNFYMLSMTMQLATPVDGTARLAVMEDFGGGAVESAAQTLVLRQGDMDVEMRIPAGDLRARRIKAVLTDPADGNHLASLMINDTAALNVLKKVFAGRSYYSVEPAAEVRVELGLPAGLLAQAALVLESGGATLVELNGLSPVLTPAIPLAALKYGDNAVKVRVLSGGRELASQTINIVRLEPRPGYETKADFIRGVFLKEQNPVFPLGLCAHKLQGRLGINGCTVDDEAIFKYLAEDIGVDTLVMMGNVNEGTTTNLDAFMQMSQKYGLDVVVWTSPQPWPMGMTPGAWPPPPQTNSLADRLAYQRRWYEGLEPGIIADTKNLREYKNLIAYWNVDEPNLVNPDERIAAAEWYWKTVKPLDPHRLFLLLYARDIPEGDNWTRWGDGIAYDVYPPPYFGVFSSEPGLSTAYYAWQLRERCRQDNKIMWFVPLANLLDPGRTPIGMNKAHMLCQAYAAIIYGARGFLHFTLCNMVGEDAWDGLRTIVTQVKAMTPALVNGDVAQNVKYTPDDFYPRERKFPMVNAAVFRYPDGDYLLLAVNIMPHAVDTTFQVGGLEHAARMFAVEGQRGKGAEGQRAMVLDGETFTDKIEPYGVRAYRMKLSDSPVPVTVALAMTPVKEERAPAVDIPRIARQVMLRDNHMPNPCFEQQTNPGVPDFYCPWFCLTVDPFWGQKGRSDWFVDDSVLWNGHPSLRMLRRDFHDGGCKTRGLGFVAYPPSNDQPVKMTFSLYARSETPKAGLWMQMIGVKPVTIGNLTDTWQRYHFSFDMPPGTGENRGARKFLLAPTPGAVVWINGLQLNQGDQPLEFRDDSIPLKKKAVIGPDNLIPNPGAESVSTDYWNGLANLGLGEAGFGLMRGVGRSGGYAFCWRGQSSGVYSDWIAIDRNKAYTLRGWFKAGAGGFTGVTFGVVMADAQEREIKRINVSSVKGSGTQLAAPCRAGDRLLRVRDGAGWRTGALYATAFGAAENELVFDLTPPGIQEVRREDGAWVIELNQPCGFDRPAGTPAVENQAGNNGIFLPGAVQAEIAGEWMEFKGEIKAGDWWPGTAYARVVIIGLGIRRGQTAGMLLMDDFELRISPES